MLRAVIEETVKQAQAKWDYVYERCSTEEARTTSRTGVYTRPHASQRRCRTDSARTWIDRERVLADPMDTSFTYGEIDWFSFASLLERAAPQRGDVFIDVGSGSGRALIAAALLHGHRFRQCIGIELLPGLHHLARESVARYARMIENIEASDSGTIKRRYPAVRAVQADLLSYDWSDGDVVFANSTCFSEELMEQLTEKAERLKSGARLITLTKGVESDAFELLSRQRYTVRCAPHCRRGQPPRFSPQLRRVGRCRGVERLCFCISASEHACILDLCSGSGPSGSAELYASPSLPFVVPLLLKVDALRCAPHTARCQRRLASLKSQLHKLEAVRS